MSIPLELTGLSKVFDTPTGPFVAVKDVNAQVKAGEFVAILGHSGCGKSTVLSIIAGLDQATLGGVIIDGTEVVGPGAERAIVFQAPCLLPWMTARENVRLAVAQRPGMRRLRDQLAAADRYLAIVGVADAAGQIPAQLSLGTQQCVSLARALAAEPRFLLLDEPFSQLDSLTRYELQDTLLRVWEETDKTVVRVTHDVDEAMYLAAHPDDRRPRGDGRRRARGPVSASAKQGGRPRPIRLSRSAARRDRFSGTPRPPVATERARRDPESASRREVGVRHSRLLKPKKLRFCHDSAAAPSAPRMALTG